MVREGRVSLILVPFFVLCLRYALLLRKQRLAYTLMKSLEGCSHMLSGPLLILRPFNSRFALSSRMSPILLFAMSVALMSVQASVSYGLYGGVDALQKASHGVLRSFAMAI